MALRVQPDGRLILGGAFTNFDGVARAGLARLQPDGRLDLTFAAAGGLTGRVGSNVVTALASQAGGRLLVGGSFTEVNGAPRANCARLLSNGELDSTFNPPGDLVPVSSLFVQSDDTVVVAGAGSGDLLVVNRAT